MNIQTTMLYIGLGIASLANIASVQSNKPNVLFVFIDDLGWKDLGCYGGKFIETPAADSLAAEGMMFTQAYASPVCSPTRASLISGQNAARHGVWEVIGVNDRPYAKMSSPLRKLEIDENIQTYADILNKEGYTCGLIGKWHAGRTPQAHGFCKIDKKIHDPVLKKYAHENDEHKVGEITANSIEFLSKNKDNPFFLCVSHHAAHAPLIARDDLINKYRKKLRKTGITDVHPNYAALVEMADESLRMLLDELKALKLEDNTMVVFYSDNGGMIKDMYLKQPEALATTMAPLRWQKGSLYEGGIRVPFIVKWPGKIKPGTSSEQMLNSFDLFSTFVDVCGGTIPQEQVTDGLSLVPVLRGETELLERDTLYWHFPTSMWTRSPAGAIRKGDYKLIEHFEDGRIELFNLKDDIGETVNLLYSESEKASELLSALTAWRRSLDAQMPTPNPNYDPVRAHEHAYHKWLEPKQKK